MIAEKILGNISESTPSVEVDTVELLIGLKPRKSA